MTSGAAWSAPVINEIHYNPPDNVVRQEFIEILNPDEGPIDLSGWRLSGAVDFTFPDGTTLAPDGFLVVGEDPPTLRELYGLEALGPWSGSLDSEGETVRLRDPSDEVVDLVDYQVGFPWPVASNGSGASIELVDPALDNAVGSHWRAGRIPPVTERIFLPAGSGNWRWRPGADEASDPVSLWRQPGFDEDDTWTTHATPIGFGGVTGVELAEPEIEGMQFGFPSVFLRNTFAIPAGEMPSKLRLRFTLDDGMIVWLNGVEILRHNVDPGEPVAGFGGTTANAGGMEGAWIERDLPAPAALVEGVNTLAIQVFNESIGSSDLGFDLEVLRPANPVTELVATPGAPNASRLGNAPPAIRKVGHLPQVPKSGEPVVVTARVSDPDGVAAVELEYQVVPPGAYVPALLPHPIINNRIPQYRDPLRENPAYHDPANWTRLAMLDDGAGLDETAGDGIFTVVLPARTHRTLVRYRITVTDDRGASARVPYPDDESLNFACFVYDGVPDYTAAQSLQGGAVTYPAEMLTRYPVYQVITRNEDWMQCHAWFDGSLEIQQGQGNLDRFFYNWTGTLVHDGVVYDNIRYRLRGANGRYHQNGKRSMRFRFNDGHHFQALDQEGQPFPRKWRTLTTGKGFENRGTLTFGLNEALNMFLWDRIGLPAQRTFWAHWRVVDDAEEAADQWRGDFWGLNFILETYDVRFLEGHDLPKGNLYKLINQERSAAQQQRYQHAFAVADGSDHDNIERNLRGSSTADFIRAHVELEKYYLYHGLSECIRNYDFWPDANKNMVYYFHPTYTEANGYLGKLWILPWDSDATWGPTWNSGHDVVYNSIFPASGGGSDSQSTPELWPEYHNVIRELRDLLWQPDQLEPLIDEFAAVIAPMVPADFDRWKNVPTPINREAGTYSGLSGAGIRSLDDLVRDLKNFAFVGGSWPGGSVGAGGRGAHLDALQGSRGEGGRLPETPTITFAGDPGFPVDGLRFRSSPFSDPQGAGSFGAMEWRVAEVTDPSAPGHDPAEPFRLEIVADWESGELASFQPEVVVPLTATRPERTYRARVRHRDDTGRWSHWSAAVAFTTAPADIDAYLAGLVVSEIMFHPADPSAEEAAAGFQDGDFEFIELHNRGGTPLDLAPIRFTKGVDFDFDGSAITTLAPGAVVLVVADEAAFRMRYGDGLPVAGAWDPGDRLDNGGERLKLSFGAGVPVRELVYDDRAPWPSAADGQGASLTLADPAASPPLDHAAASSWRASFARHGTPGRLETSDVLTGWMEANGITDLDADDDGDRRVNLLEFMLATDPRDGNTPPDGGPAVTVRGAGPDREVHVRFRRPIGADAVVVYVVEVSPDLVGWVPGEIAGIVQDPPVAGEDGTESVTLRLPAPVDGPAIRFLRLRGELAPAAP